MRATTVKLREKRLRKSVQTSENQTKGRLKPAAKIKNGVRFGREMPETRHNGPKKLDRRKKWRQHAKDGSLIWECRIRECRVKAKSINTDCGRLLFWGSTGWPGFYVLSCNPPPVILNKVDITCQ
jgi:hypothetical protein